LSIAARTKLRPKAGTNSSLPALESCALAQAHSALELAATALELAATTLELGTAALKLAASSLELAATALKLGPAPTTGKAKATARWSASAHHALQGSG
jgi:hypothetical protein